MKKAGIIGCGWLGLPLAKHLILNHFEVKGTTTQPSKFSDLERESIQPFVFKLGEPINRDFLRGLDVLIICFPNASKHASELYETFAQDLANNVEPTTNIIFTSSTSVYTQHQTEADEINGQLDTTSVNLKFERSLQKYLKNKLTILRLGGLVGENRNPVHFLAGRIGIPSGNAPINLVHQNDVIQAIWTVIEENKFDAVFNCVFPLHPPKNEYYTSEALKRNLMPPTFVTDDSIHKIVNGQSITENTSFTYNFQP